MRLAGSMQVGVADVAAEVRPTRQLEMQAAYKCSLLLSNLQAHTTSTALSDKEPSPYSHIAFLEKIMLFLALPILACIGFTTVGVSSGTHDYYA